ncbi:MAG: aspartate dehydrogenase [Candidatus Thermoplasmatota archaeon]|nr:aspartate dehydrogenase [Candidatus Thermoplasmatota archaeon]
MNICVIGCGAIGTTIARAVEPMPEINIVYLTDRSKECATRLQEKMTKVRYVPDIVPILNDIQLVVEAASQDAARYYVPLALSAGVDVLVMSVGVFQDEEFQKDVFKLAKRKSVKIYMPSGAIGGIDALGAASLEQIDEVTLTTTKPPSAFGPNPYLESKGIVASELRERTELFYGTAREAVKHFPQNINIAATISLTGIGFEKTSIRIMCDPQVQTNEHHLKAKGKFGELDVVTRNVPSPRNPKTSYLAALSAISAIKKITGTIWVGV